MTAGPADDRASPIRSGDILSRARENTGPRFALVVVLVLLMMALTMALPEGIGISLVALVAGLALITAAWASRVTARFLRLVTAFVTTAAALSIASLVLDSRASTTATAIVAPLFAVAVPIAIVVGLQDEREINAQTVFGALSVYLLAGLFFTLLISVVARLTGSPYIAQGTDGSPKAVGDRAPWSWRPSEIDPT